MSRHTAELLEKHFDTAFAAPDGIKKLRELILTLAMLGKLVPQDPDEQPASELLQEIEVEKQRLMKEGKIKKPKSLPPIREEEKLYSLPRGWEWARLQSFSDYNGRPNIDPSEIAEDTWLLDLEDIEKETSRLICRARYFQRESKSTKSTFKEGDVLYGKLRPYLDKVLVADSAGACTTEIVPIVPSKAVIPEFLRWLLKRPDFLSHVNTLMYGVKMPRLGTEDAIHSVHPIPPVNEQYRIVAKINELMIRCDGLEKLRTAQKKTRLTVHAAAIKQLLNIAEPDQHQRAQIFLAEHFGELYTVKEDVAELRKVILQLAMMGKLVPQDPKDKPASELLKEIEEKKRRLVKQGKIKKPKPLPPVTEGEKPYALPQGWEWVRFFATNTVKSELVSAGDFPDENQIAPDSIEKDTGSLLLHRTVAESGATGPNNRFYEGQILYSKIRPSLNKAVVAPYDGLCSADMYPIVCHVCTDFMLKVILSETFLAQVRLAENRIKMPKLNLESLGQFLIPLPPLAEQRHIVARTDQLMNLCDLLAQQIDAATIKQAELLGAVIAQV
ncbi:MAG: restriction endonuclease subunit S [Castellaniella sp.]|uniref:restriction endonuclease subunit S n=1 Tax=Castellaniella sp. TaxID=1955812 RepID=UPI003C72CE07